MKNILLFAVVCYCASVSAEYNTGPFPTSLGELSALFSESGNEEGCQAQLQIQPYCVLSNQSGRDIFVEAYVIIDKQALDGRFNTKEKIVAQYLAFDRWPEYASASNLGYIIEFPVSEIIRDELSGNGDREIAHHFDYISKAPTLTGRQRIIGSSTYRLLSSSNPGAVFSAEFQNTAEWGGDWVLITPRPAGEVKGRGIRGQDANIHVVDLENEDKFLLIYRSRINLASLASGWRIVRRLLDPSEYVVGALNSIVIGMFVNPPPN